MCACFVVFVPGKLQSANRTFLKFERARASLALSCVASRYPTHHPGNGGVGFVRRPSELPPIAPPVRPEAWCVQPTVTSRTSAYLSRRRRGRVPPPPPLTLFWLRG